jgi:eukaryotic-like serine/threonine-protein kinase
VPQTFGDSTLGAGVGTEREDTLDQGPPPLADVRALLGTDEIVAERFALESVLGAGAMGIVLAARDLLLDRVVALKILRRESSDPTNEMHERIVREARALAQVAHPNVITVFDVGRIAGRTYVAMELVRGVDLRRWLERESDARARVAALVQAGHGLAAAHAVGVVHRDFKPENVLIGSDGRVRVADFGLAHTIAPGKASTLRSGSVATYHALVGTPTYMAPEQFLGAAASAHTDQFGFFVALYEALHGKRPFTGNTIYELAAALLHEEPLTAPVGRGFARRLWPVIQRGLSRDPGRRFPDMDAALAAIERAGVARRAWRWPAFVGATAIAAAGAAWPSDPPSMCERLRERRLALWNDDARSRLRGSLHAAGTSFADTTALTVEREIDAWMLTWDREHAWACGSERLDARHDCLGSALARVAALTDALANASPADVRRAVAAAFDLPRPDQCRAASAFVGDPALRERFAALAAAHQLAHTGDALRIARELVAATANGSDPASAVKAHLDLGLVLAEIEDHDDAESELSTAFFAAVALGDEASATESATALAHLHTFALARFDDADTWVRHAEAHARDDDHRFTATLAAAHLEYARGRYDEACAAFTRALELPGTSRLRLAALHYDLGFTRHLQGRQDEAVAQLDRSLDLFEAELGATHPEVGDVLLARSQVAVVLGDLDGARALAERGLAIAEGAYGPDHSDVAKALTHLAETMPDPADDIRVFALLERAVAIMERTRGADNPATAAVLTDLANRRGAAGDHSRALVLGQRALRIAEESLGEHPFVAAAMHNVARELDALGRHDEARVTWTKAIALRGRLLGGDDPGLLPPLVGLGKLEIAAGRRTEGVAVLERAWAVAVAHADRSHVAGLVAWTLAQAIEPDDPTRALELAREGHARVKSDPQLRRDVAGEIERWIAAHAS